MSLKSTISLNGKETVLNDIKLEGNFADLVRAIRSEQASCESYFAKVLAAETNAAPTKKLKVEENEAEGEMEEEDDEINLQINQNGEDEQTEEVES